MDDVNTGQDLVGETAVVRPLHVGQHLVSYLIAERAVDPEIRHDTLLALKRSLQAAFNTSEIKSLCFELAIPYEDLGADTHNGRIQALVQYGQRHGRLGDIATYGRRSRPRLAWPNLADMQSTFIQEKDALAVVVCINHRVLHLAAEFLAKEEIDSNYLLLTTVPDYATTQWLPEDATWNLAVQDFYQTMQKVPATQHHFFIAAPIPYAFAIGCVWSLVNDRDKLYHWDGTRYVHVITTTRTWKR